MASATPLPPPLGEDRTRRLRALSRVHQPGRTDAAADQGGPALLDTVTALPARSKTRARRAVKKVLRRSFEIAGGRPLIERLNALQVRLDDQHEQIEAMRTGWVDVELGRAFQNRGLQDAESTRINLELLKGEVRELKHTLAELGMAFAPSAGLAGAAARFAELRENVNGLERRLRNLSLGQPASTAEDGVPPAVVPQVETQTSALFNYVGFERRFRGDPEAINATLLERYGEQLAEHQPVVDIGCGRAELLESLAARGVEVIGVEPDSGMVAEGRARGITVHQALAGDYLRSVPDHSIGSIITTHVVEHLPLDALIETLELSVRKLRPGGMFISETPNPASLIVLGTHYIIDPTHVMPLHPSLLAFLCESAGFRDVRVKFFSPATEYHLGHVEVPDETSEWARAVVQQINDNVDRLNQVLFGPQDYAVLATTPAGPAPAT